MFNIFKKVKKTTEKDKKVSFEIELTACVLAYEVARSDGDISQDELRVLLIEIKKITANVGKSEDEILNIIQEYSKNSISFHEFIEDIKAETYTVRQIQSTVGLLYGSLQQQNREWPQPA